MGAMKRMGKVPTILLFLPGALLLFHLNIWPHGKKSWPVPKAARELQNPVPHTEEARTAGMKTYVNQCSMCHGERGDGEGPMAAGLSEKPADFTDAHMMREMTDGEIFWKITEGRDPMPSFKKSLTQTQRWQLVHYLRSLAGTKAHTEHSGGKK